MGGRSVTTSYEYHSARRLFKNLEHFGWITLLIINVDEAKVITNVEKAFSSIDLKLKTICFLSQSSFLTSYTHNENDLMLLARKFPNVNFLVDCYHSFAARKLNFQNAPENFSILAGGYKYAMSGEGVCFLAMNSHLNFHEPLFNGWLSEFSLLDSHNSFTSFTESSSFWKMMGATFDPSGLFRFVGIWNNWESQNVTIEMFRAYVISLQEKFVQLLNEKILLRLCKFEKENQGNFISLHISTSQNIAIINKDLKNLGILCDSRGQYVRFGFSPYIDENDVRNLAKQLNSLQEVLL